MQAVTAAGQAETHCEMTNQLYFQLLAFPGRWHAVCATPSGAWKATPFRETRMLRVEFNHDGNGTLFVQLQGRLVGPYAEDARMTLARYQVPPTIVVDLSEVTFIDSLGEEVLLWLGRMGSEFAADNVYARSVCERLQLHISQKRLAHLSGTKSQVSL